MSHTDDTETRIVDGDSLGTRVIEKDKVQPAPPEGRGDHPTITGDTARQGPAGSRVLLVLAVGFTGALIVLVIAYAFWAA